jgi:hypothetical protein
VADCRFFLRGASFGFDDTGGFAVANDLVVLVVVDGGVASGKSLREASGSSAASWPDAGAEATACTPELLRNPSLKVDKSMPLPALVAEKALEASMLEQL